MTFPSVNKGQDAEVEGGRRPNLLKLELAGDVYDLDSVLNRTNAFLVLWEKSYRLAVVLSAIQCVSRHESPAGTTKAKPLS